MGRKKFGKQDVTEVCCETCKEHIVEETEETETEDPEESEPEGKIDKTDGDDGEDPTPPTTTECPTDSDELKTIWDNLVYERDDQNGRCEPELHCDVSGIVIGCTRETIACTPNEWIYCGDD